MKMRVITVVIVALVTSWAAWGQSGNISTVAGTGSLGSSGDGGPATAATLFQPDGVAVDASGNIFIADRNNNRIREVSVSTDIITTVAGNGTSGFSGDGGSATAAKLSSPSGVAVDASGNIYIADNYNLRIRKVTASTGIITTVAGGGNGTIGDGGAATSASLSGPWGVAVDNSGNIFIADVGHRIRKVTASTGIITTVAGTGSPGFSGDGGSATSASLNSPGGVAVDASGNIFIADTDNNRIRKVTAATGIITTVAGNGTQGFSGDSGPATSAELYHPMGLALDASGNILIADDNNNRIREVSAATGVITTAAGGGTSLGDGGPATSALLSNPFGVAVDASGDLFVADSGEDRVREVVPYVAGAPTITPGGIVPVDSTITTIQPGEWVSIYGTNLGPSLPVSWNGDFPTSLGGTSVTINDKPAYLLYVSSTQVNVQAPDDTATGLVSVTVKTAIGSASATVTLAQFAPSFLLLDSKHVAGVILRPDGSGAYGSGAYSFDILGPTVAAKAGDTIELFAVGLGPTSPVVPAGQLFSGAASTTNSVDLLINNASEIPSFAGLSEAGVYQINLTLPAGLGIGDVPLEATVGGTHTQSGVVMSLQDPAAPQVLSLTLSPTSVTSGGTVTGTVALTGAALSGGAVVTLSSSSSAASVPATVTVAAGATSATFTVTAGTVSSTQTVTIMASYGGGSAHASLTVMPAAVNPNCANVGGSWNASESGTVSALLNAAGEVDTETDPVSGSGLVTITQTGCSIQYNPISDGGFLGGTSNLARTGTVTGNNVTVSGPLAVLATVESVEIAENPGLQIISANVSSNLLTATGQVSGSVMTLNGSGTFAVSGSFSYLGENGSYTFSMTSNTTATFDMTSGGAAARPSNSPGHSTSTTSVEVHGVPDRADIAARIRAAFRKALVIGE